ncbi:hypothetical protein BT63DRAFT_138382 [Microthyrium microscopicum]|uniref:Uncharacterized protein n=1 Tax=Microthyrium microscopicum TaxID=703497 RepID=A0A6A6UMC4_9PEZI|nr:hypothetical protein BT63DRAFT_138382 [Microthyrium microscopicum]
MPPKGPNKELKIGGPHATNIGYLFEGLFQSIFCPEKGFIIHGYEGSKIDLVFSTIELSPHFGGKKHIDVHEAFQAGHNLINNQDSHQFRALGIDCKTYCISPAHSGPTLLPHQNPLFVLFQSITHPGCFGIIPAQVYRHFRSRKSPSYSILPEFWPFFIPSLDKGVEFFLELTRPAETDIVYPSGFTIKRRIVQPNWDYETTKQALMPQGNHEQSYKYIQKIFSAAKRAGIEARFSSYSPRPYDFTIGGITIEHKTLNQWLREWQSRPSAMHTVLIWEHDDKNIAASFRDPDNIPQYFTFKKDFDGPNQEPNYHRLFKWLYANVFKKAPPKIKHIDPVDDDVEAQEPELFVEESSAPDSVDLMKRQHVKALNNICCDYATGFVQDLPAENPDGNYSITFKEWTLPQRQDYLIRQTSPYDPWDAAEDKHLALWLVEYYNGRDTNEFTSWKYRLENNRFFILSFPANKYTSPEAFNVKDNCCLPSELVEPFNGTAKPWGTRSYSYSHLGIHAGTRNKNRPRTLSLETLVPTQVRTTLKTQWHHPLESIWKNLFRACANGTYLLERSQQLIQLDEEYDQDFNTLFQKSLKDHIEISTEAEPAQDKEDTKVDKGVQHSSPPLVPIGSSDNDASPTRISKDEAPSVDALTLAEKKPKGPPKNYLDKSHQPNDPDPVDKLKAPIRCAFKPDSPIPGVPGVYELRWYGVCAGLRRLPGIVDDQQVLEQYQDIAMICMKIDYKRDPTTGLKHPESFSLDSLLEETVQGLFSGVHNNDFVNMLIPRHFRFEKPRVSDNTDSVKTISSILKSHEKRETIEWTELLSACVLNIVSFGGQIRKNETQASQDQKKLVEKTMEFARILSDKERVEYGKVLAEYEKKWPETLK